MIKEDVWCERCGGLLLWADDEIGYKCTTCARTPLTTKPSTPEIEAEARVAMFAWASLTAHYG